MDRLPPAAAAALEAATELYASAGLALVHVSRELETARESLSRHHRDQAALAQVELALADLAHMAERLRQLHHRAAELGGVPLEPPAHVRGTTGWPP